MGSTHVVEQLSFFMFPSIPTFDFDLILGSFLTFWTLMGLMGLGWGSQTILGSTHAVEQLSFSMISLILTIEFDLILGSFFYFFGL